MRRRVRGGGAVGAKAGKSRPVYRGRCATARPCPPARSCARRASAGGRSALSGAHWRRDWARSGNSAAAAGPHSSAIRFGVARRAARAAPLPRSAKPTHLSPLSDASTRVVLPAECQPSWACTAATRHPHPLNLLQRPPPLHQVEPPTHQVPISANLGNCGAVSRAQHRAPARALPAQRQYGHLSCYRAPLEGLGVLQQARLVPIRYGPRTNFWQWSAPPTARCAPPCVPETSCVGRAQ